MENILESHFSNQSKNLVFGYSKFKTLQMSPKSRDTPIPPNINTVFLIKLRNQLIGTNK
jgi:hypothetical protein